MKKLMDDRLIIRLKKMSSRNTESVPAGEGTEEQSSEQGMQTDEEDLKAYLGDTLVPLLAYALDELEKVRPPDPVLFLAHFLLRHNPKKSYQ